MLTDPLAISFDTSTPVDPLKPTTVKPRRRLLQPIPSDPTSFILEVDYSTLSNFLLCKRRGLYSMVFGRESRRSSAATSWGTCFHKCEDERLRHGHITEVFSRQREIVGKHFVDNPVSGDEYRTAARMLSILDLYNNLYVGDGWPSSVIVHSDVRMVERPYKIPLCTIPINATLPYPRNLLVAGCTDPTDTSKVFIANLHIILTGKIDAVLSVGGQPWVVDHKTSSRGGKEFEAYFRLSLQTRGYVWAVHKLGIPAVGMILNAVVTRPLTKTGTGQDFVRHEYLYSPSLITQYEASVTSHITDLVNCLIAGDFPETSLSFISPCVKCDYQETCCLPSDQRLGDLASDVYRDITWDPTGESED